MLRDNRLSSRSMQRDQPFCEVCFIPVRCFLLKSYGIEILAFVKNITFIHFFVLKARQKWVIFPVEMLKYFRQKLLPVT